MDRGVHPGGLQSMGRKESGMTEQLTQTLTYLFAPNFVHCQDGFIIY